MRQTSTHTVDVYLTQRPLHTPWFAGLVTALVPVIGYEKSAGIAKEALKTGGSVYNLVLEKGLLSQETLDDMLRPENMTDPRKIPK
mgnify:CR=1 FL=1